MNGFLSMIYKSMISTTLVFTVILLAVVILYCMVGRKSPKLFDTLMITSVFIFNIAIFRAIRINVIDQITIPNDTWVRACISLIFAIAQLVIPFISAIIYRSMED